MNPCNITAFLVCVLVMTSCGTARRLSQEAEVRSAETSREVELRLDSLQSVVNTLVNERVQMVLSQDMQIVRRDYSKPDSAGRQYVESETLVNLVTDLAENKDMAVQTTDSTSSASSSMSINSSLTQVSADISTDERKGLAWWQKVLMGLGAALIVFMIIKILRLCKL